MAEAVIETEVRSSVPRFYCHMCSEEVNHILPEFICPRCECGFIEQVSRSPEETSDESGDDIEALLHSVGGTIEDVARRTRWRRMQALELSDPEDQQVTNDDRSTTFVYRRPRREAARWRRDRARRMARIEHSDRDSQSLNTDEDDSFDTGQRYSQLGSPRNASARDRENALIWQQMAAALAERGMENAAAHHFLLNLSGNPGDYAWGHEGLDAIITQLLNQTDTKGPPALSKEKIEEIPIVHIAQEQVDKAVQCSVCMEDFRLAEEVKELPCKHHFHINCIVPWLELHATCPICRTLLYEDTSYLSSSSTSSSTSSSSSSSSSSTEGRNSECRRDSERTSSTSSSFCDFGYSTVTRDFREDSD